VISQFGRQSKHANIVMSSRGRYCGASSFPFSEYKKQPGDKLGLNRRIHGSSRRVSRYVLFDSNFWKSLLHSRLAVAQGDPGSL